jgi:hypothetical protein
LAAIILFDGSSNALGFVDAGFLVLENGYTFEFVGFVKSCEYIDIYFILLYYN